MTDNQRENEESNKGFKVVDRRRFGSDGTTRQDVPDPVRPPDPPMPPKAAPAAPPASTKGGPATAAGVPSPAPAAAEPPPPAPDGYPDEAENPAGGPIDFLAFVQSLGQQALMQLGLVPYPDTGLVEQSLPLARQTIDILTMLQQKTKGNLQPKESRFMDALVYDLRMAYVKVTEAAVKQAMPNLKKGPPGRP